MPNAIDKCIDKIQCHKKRNNHVSCFSEVFSGFIAHRCSIKPNSVSLYTEFMREFSYYSRENYDSEIVFNRDNLNNYLRKVYSDIYIFDNYLLGLRIWY